jgi:hypothetical protein
MDIASKLCFKSQVSARALAEQAFTINKVLKNGLKIGNVDIIIQSLKGFQNIVF